MAWNRLREETVRAATKARPAIRTAPMRGMGETVTATSMKVPDVAGRKDALVVGRKELRDVPMR